MQVDEVMHDEAIHEVKKALGLLHRMKKEGFRAESLQQSIDLLSVAVAEFYDEIKE